MSIHLNRIWLVSLSYKSYMMFINLFLIVYFIFMIINSFYLSVFPNVSPKPLTSLSFLSFKLMASFFLKKCCYMYICMYMYAYIPTYNLCNLHIALCMHVFMANNMILDNRLVISSFGKSIYPTFSML